MVGITEYLEILLAGRDLDFGQAKTLLDTVFQGDTAEAQVAAFLTAMRIKTPVANELAGFAQSLRDHAVAVNTDVDNLVDTCGTGGASYKTFNISTAAAIVAAGAGVYVAKHGNRAITSNCGSADVLAAFGVNIDPGPEIVAECIRRAHIGFMFAPKFHPAMKYVQPIRKSLGFRTVFNILGPLANPAGASAQVLGAADEKLMPLIAETLNILGVKRAMVVHSEGLDEISTMGKTKILHLKDGRITADEINPIDCDIALADFDSLKGGDAETNAGIVRDIICGDETGPGKDIVLLNAAASIIVAGLADDFNTAIDLAENTIKQGGAKEALDKMIETSNS